MEYSVLMSLYKKENPQWFQMAVDSMVSQTVKPEQIVIVEDGRLPDELEIVVKGYEISDPSLFTVVRNPVNQGLGKALNTGLQVCRNELVARMDTDDVSLPMRCEKELNYFAANDELVMVGSWVDEFVDDRNVIVSTRKVPTDYTSIRKFASKRNPFNHPTVMYKKSKVMELGGYSSLRYGQDYELFGRMLIHNFEVTNIPESLLLFRSDNNTVLRRKNKESIDCYLKTIKEFQKAGFSSWKDYLFVYITQNLVRVLPKQIVNKAYKLVRKR